MEPIENICHDGPMRFGIGPVEHHEVLRRALDCEQVVTIDQIDAMMIANLPTFLRLDANDVAVFTRPSYLTPRHYKWLASSKAIFEVPGHEPRRLITWADRQEFRGLKPSVDRVEVPETRGAPKTYQIPPEYHETAIALWHDGEMKDGRWRATWKPSEIEDRIERDTGVRVKFTWVRDLAKAKVGHTKRNPNA